MIKRRSTSRHEDFERIIVSSAIGQGITNEDGINEKCDLVFNHGYSARIYFVDAENVDAVPRSIKNTRTSFVFGVDLIKEPGRIIAYPHKDGRKETPR